VTRSGSTSGELVVDLASDDTSEATVPLSVTILDGNSSASFEIAAVDDSDVDGTQTVTFTATASGYTSGSDTLDVTDNDAIRIIDNGDADFTQTNFEYYTGTPAYEQDNHSWRSGSGAGEASWSFSNLEDGQYQVAATWYAKYNRATDAPYTITDVNGVVLATTSVNQKIAPGDFSDSGANWDTLATINVTGGALVVTLNESPGNEGWVIADAVRIELLGESLILVVAATSVSEGDGAAATTATVTRSGSTSGELVVDLASDDTSEATVPLSVTILDGNSSASFEIAAVDDSDVDGTQTVTFTATASGYTSGSDTLDVTDNDAIRIIDNGDADFTQTNFEYYTGTPAYEQDNHSWRSGSGAGEASWSFSNLEDGQYQVAATWYAKYNRATDAPYTITDVNGVVLATTSVNQKIAPGEFSDSGANWDTLVTVNVTGGALVVTLNESPGNEGWVIADAVRIVRVGDLSGSSLAGNSAQAAAEALAEDNLSEVLDELAADWQQVLAGDQADPFAGL
jgi:hypothetical protein